MTEKRLAEHAPSELQKLFDRVRTVRSYVLCVKASCVIARLIEEWGAVGVSACPVGADHGVLLERATCGIAARLHASGRATYVVPRFPTWRCLCCGLGWDLSSRQCEDLGLNDLAMT